MTGEPHDKHRSGRASIATVVRAAVLALCLVAPGASGELSERVVVIPKMADLRIKLVDHLADELWRVGLRITDAHQLHESGRSS